MDFSQIDGKRQFRFMETLNYVRAAGTKEEEKAADGIAAMAEKFSDGVKKEPFSFECRIAEQELLEVISPYSGMVPAAVYKNCGNTSAAGVTAPLFYAENGDEISLRQSKGKIVMINGPVQEKQYQQMMEAGAVGFISVSGSPADTGEARHPACRTIKHLAKEGIPGITIHYTDAVKLAESEAATVRLAVRQKKTVLHSQNVTAVIEGTTKKDEILTLTAHYDSVPQGPGAYDNLAGAAIIMELCRYFSRNRPARTLQFIWFGAEEQGLKGSRAYVEQHLQELCDHQFNMNVDLAGQLIGGNVLGITGTARTADWCRNLMEQAGRGCEVKNQVWSSDSNTFAWKGIPSMTLNRDGYGMHTCHDTMELISPWSLQRSAGLLGYLAETLANAEQFPLERKIPEEMQAELQDYFCRRT
ncbi:MAG: M20/M25/M40 family metallo-hydrolase [Lachnospiraceae bacterium]|nr:M20/M25/M40 family metallo-hydrolase [Lachnospiraceae bacterium]